VLKLEVNQRSRQGSFVAAGYELRADGIWGKGGSELVTVEGVVKEVEVEEGGMEVGGLRAGGVG